MLTLLMGRAAHADEAEPEPVFPEATRRSGFAMGLDFGAELAKISGFPNDAKKIGQSSYLTSTGLGFGGGGTAWVGIALADWLTFGLGGSADTFKVASTTTTTYAFAVHVEGFPLFALGGHLRDLGVLFDAGTGVTSTSAAAGPDLIDSGGASRVRGGVFYEGLRFSKLAMGPFVSTDYVWSDSARRGGVMLGWRTAFYALP